MTSLLPLHPPDNLFALDLGCLEKGWEEMSFMLSKRDDMATTIFQSRYINSLEIGHPNLMNTQRLVALGGWNGINSLRSAEIYDPGLKPKDSTLFRHDMGDLTL